MDDEANKNKADQATKCDVQMNETWDDIEVMVNFAKATGKVLSPTVRDLLSQLCYPGTDSNAKPEELRQARYAKMLEAHGALCQLVAPATPVTIRASRTDGKIWIENTTVRILLSFSLASLVVFLVTAIWEESSVLGAVRPNVGATTNAATLGTNTFPVVSGSRTNAAALTSEEKKPAQPPGAIDILMILAAAGLGAGFYGLYTAHSYIADQTFDPKYNSIYVVRFVLGLTSGTILGYFGTSLFHPTSSGFDPKQLGPPVLALVGGYAAEAVSQILQRIADTLVALVKGTNDDANAAKKKELEASSKQQETQRRIEMMKPLQEAKEAILKMGSAAPPDAQNAVQKALDSLLK